MADNIFGRKFYAEEKIAVETDYNNILLIDPNKIVTPDGKFEERNVQQENLVMYANLEAKFLPRTKLANGVTLEESIYNVPIANMNINFLNPGQKGFLDSSWTDYITGENSLKQQGQNQIKTNTKIDSNNQQVINRTVVNQNDNQTLGIKSIKIRNTTAQVPQVDIELVDVQGRTLFEQGENSIYSAFFQLPYPIFTLTIKGYYGKAVQYQLNLLSFNTRFDPSDGSYKVSLKFIGRTTQLLYDINLSQLVTLPKMFPITVNSETEITEPSESKTTTVSNTQTTRGIQKLFEVYDLYESKNLIPENFPRLTIEEMVSRYENFQNIIVKQYGEQDMSVLNDIVEYEKQIQTYKNQIVGVGENSWFGKYMDGFNFYVSKDGQTRYYKFKQDITEDQKNTARSELKDLYISQNNKKLAENKTFGNDGNFTIDGERIVTEVINDIDYKDFYKTFDKENIDWDKTYQQRFRVSGSTTQIIAFKLTEEANILLLTNKLDENGEPVETEPQFFIFGDTAIPGSYTLNSFYFKINKILQDFLPKKQKVELLMSERLAKKISSDQGLGFYPSVRNVVAIIIASADAFLSLMDDVHRNAWNQRQNPVRLNSIINSNTSGIGTDTKQSLQTNSQGLDFVYPWPQYFELERDSQGNEFYVEKYPGDVDSISSTQGYLSDVWPEIEFTEEFIRASQRTTVAKTDNDYGNPAISATFVPVTSLEFPLSQTPYKTSAIVNNLYEIFERSYLIAYYNNVNFGTEDKFEIFKSFADLETLNILNNLDNFDTKQLLKNYKFTSENFLEVLKQFSNEGTGISYQQYERDIFTTPYIQEFVENPNQIYNSQTIDSKSIMVPDNEESVKKISELLSSSFSKNFKFDSKYPFTNITWVKNNLKGLSTIGSAVDTNNTTQTLKFNARKKLIANFESDPTVVPSMLTYNSWLKLDKCAIFTNNVTTREQVTTYYNLVEGNFSTPKGDDYGLQVTVGQYSFTAATTQVSEKFTSMLNTPFFVNSISDASEKLRNSTQYPWVSSAYLFLNSLPISGLREKYKTFENNLATELDYIYATMNKFSSIHSLPYPFVLKYGSLWHRYKTWKETGVDVVSGISQTVDYSELYDPVTSAKTKTYEIPWAGGTGITTTQIVMELNQAPTTGQTYSIMDLGVYPKFIEDFYYSLSQSSILTGYTNQDFLDANQNGLIFAKNSNSVIRKLQGYSQSNTGRTLTVNNWYQYVELENNTDFGSIQETSTGLTGSYLLIPSSGGIPINETLYECFEPGTGSQILEVTGNTSVYNGSIRSYWGAPNFGYLNMSGSPLPQPDMYFKNITQSKYQNSFNFNSTGEYDYLEDIFGVFPKNVLDIFETKFLDFSKAQQNVTSSLNVEKGYFEVDNNSDLVEQELKYQNFGLLLKELFLVETGDLPEDQNQRAAVLADAQQKKITSIIDGFLNFRVLLKLGNPSLYNRRIWNSFKLTEKPTDPYLFGSYLPGSLPSSDGTTTLTQSQTQYPDEWEKLYTTIGFSTIPELQYKNTGSYITDFFIDNNISFSLGNIENCAGLIKIYASRKLEETNPTTTFSAEFQQELGTYLSGTTDFQNNILNQIFTSLNKKLPTINIQTQLEPPTLDGKVTQQQLYYTFKTLNDRWIAGGDFQTKTIFEDFLFMDRANRDIGDKIVVDLEDVKNIVANPNNGGSGLLTLINTLIKDAGMYFMALPSYVNFYGIQEVGSKNSPINYDIASSAFGTYLNVDYQDSRPKFLCYYVGKPSEHLEMNQNVDYRFRGDGSDLSNPTKNTLSENQQNKTDWGKSNKVVGFAVDFGTRNQNMFKSVSLDQSQYRNTSETFSILSGLAQVASGQRAAQQSTSLFNLYRTRSYTCGVSSMGNVMIQPTMYFNLRHVPMFEGAYLITDVTHDISAGGSFDTSFNGTRIPLFALPDIDKLVTSVNKNLLSTYREKLKQIDNQKQEEERQRQQAESEKLREQERQREEELGGQHSWNTQKSSLGVGCSVSTKYTGLSATTFNTETVSIGTIISEIKALIPTSEASYQNKRLMAFCVIAQEQGGYNNGNLQQFRIPNKNVAGLYIDGSWGSIQRNDLNGFICLNITTSSGQVSRPLASFKELDKSIAIVVSRFKNKVPSGNPTTPPGQKILATNIIRNWMTSWYRLSDNWETFRNQKDIEPPYDTYGTKADKFQTKFENLIKVAKNYGLLD